MAKNYELINSHGSHGGWAWQCKAGFGTPGQPTSGMGRTKRDARDQARNYCGEAIVLIPPDIDVQIYRGHLATFSVRNLDNEKVTFSAAEISEQAFLYFSGLDCAEPKKLTPAEKAITILKIWGIYRGGLTEEGIRKAHFLNQKQFERLIAKDYFALKLSINDDNTITWKFPKDSQS